MKKLLIVCHPDDEIIFAGALLLRERDWEVLCLTNGGGRRARAFRNCMASLGLGAEIRSLPDSTKGVVDYAQLVDTLRAVDVNAYDRVLTHGLGGEYGHRQHREVSLLLHGLRADVDTFSHAPARRLPEEILLDKRALLRQFYGDRRLGYLKHWIECETTAIAQTAPVEPGS
jgi:LmbE family N-acetylglucosaminyl deacetylase